MRKNILDLKNTEARELFLKQESYINLDLPPYFRFGFLLRYISKRFKNSLSKKNITNAKKANNVNYIILGNKDGKYAWRKYQIINPLLYVSLVNLITESNNWDNLKARFTNLSSKSSIKCLSIPVIPDTRKTRQTASQVSEWLEHIERESIRLSLEFKYIHQTDITDCYGSIYTHSISWAIHGKKFSKNHRYYGSSFGGDIDHHLQAMSNGQTNGIPQGSILMDFLAEILLAYADRSITRKIRKVYTGKYKILRYRDDYRIFTKDVVSGEIIIKTISEVLCDLGLKLNTSKTFSSGDLILGSLKPDRISSFNILTGGRFNKEKLRQYLLKIYALSNTYPNCGSIKTLLIKVYQKCKKKKNFFKNREIELISILTEIGYRNPCSFPIAATFISKIIKSLNTTNKTKIIHLISDKIQELPNPGLLELWMQRISYPNKIYLDFSEKICKKIKNVDIQLFNTSWITDYATKTHIEISDCVNRTKLKKISKTININEVSLFEYN